MRCLEVGCHKRFDGPCSVPFKKPIHVHGLKRRGRSGEKSLLLFMDHFRREHKNFRP